MAEPNTPVLIGPVPLLYVQSITITEGYQIERIAGSRFSQALAAHHQDDRDRGDAARDRTGCCLKKELEALALVSRVLVAATAPLLAVTGIPVVSGLTISLDMQITDLRFTQSAQKRDAMDVQHHPAPRAPVQPHRRSSARWPTCPGRGHGAGRRAAAAQPRAKDPDHALGGGPRRPRERPRDVPP